MKELKMPHNTKEKTSAYRKKWWASLPDDRKREKQDKANLRNKDIKNFLAKYKMESGCIDCGYKGHHSALDFDHITGRKDINVCFTKSISQAKKEIEKCEVVCSNCHRIRTYNRLYPCKPDIFEMTYEKVEE